jgi:nitrous oxidase accessory protein
LLTLSGKDFLISGITFMNSGYSSQNDFASIKIIDAAGFTITDNRIINSRFGIHIANCTFFSISNNSIEGNPGEEQSTGNGIHLWKCNHAEIKNNLISGHRDGIYFEFVTDSKVSGNRSEKNIRYGLHFMFSNNDIYTQNTFNANGAGVAVMFSHHVEMDYNLFENNCGGSAYGLLLKEISDGTINRNSFMGNTIGIFMEGANRFSVTNNRFENNGWAFKIQASCSDIRVLKNNFSGNTFDVSTNGTLMLNKFENNYWDKYEGYDINSDGVGDIPYHPSSLFSTITENMPYAMMLYRSFIVMLLERTEKAIPAVTPENLVDEKPFMKPLL